MKSSLIGLTFFLSSIAQAGLITPSDLGPDEQYRIIFTTDESTTARSTDINFYNSFVSAEAERSGSIFADMGIEWKVLASASAATSTVDFLANGYQGVTAVENTGADPLVEDVALYNSRLERVADSYADFWAGTLLAPLQYDQFQNVARRIRVWTGTNDGPSYGTGVGGLGGAVATWGGAELTVNGWFLDGFGVTPTGARNSLYAISEVLTTSASSTPVPVPSSALLLALGLIFIPKLCAARG